MVRVGFVNSPAPSLHPRLRDCVPPRRPPLPIFREDSSQSAGGQNADGELTRYFCDTPDGAWAEFLRHEEIHDPQDILTIRRALWAVDIGEPPSLQPDLPENDLTGGAETWSACRQFARKHRAEADGITAPSAALQTGGARGWRVDAGLQPGPERNGRVIVLFGPRPELVGWKAAAEGRPSEDLLSNVSYFRQQR